MNKFFAFCAIALTMYAQCGLGITLFNYMYTIDITGL